MPKYLWWNSITKEGNSSLAHDKIWTYLQHGLWEAYGYSTCYGLYIYQTARETAPVSKKLEAGKFSS